MSDIKFEVTSIVKMEHRKDESFSRHLVTAIDLSVSENLDKSVYLDKKGLPTKEGTKMMTIALTQGLIANIHQGHQNEFWNDVDHLRYVISELGKGVFATGTLSEGEREILKK